MNRFELSGRLKSWEQKPAKQGKSPWGVMLIDEEVQDRFTRQMTTATHEVSVFGRSYSVAAAIVVGSPILVTGTVRARPSANGQFINASLSADEILPLALPFPGGARASQEAAQASHEIPF